MPSRIVLPVFAAVLSIGALAQSESSPRLLVQPQTLSAAFRDYRQALSATDAGATYARGQFMSGLAALKHQP